MDETGGDLALRKYPEHEKLAALDDAIQTIGEFVEWLTEQGIVIGQHHDHGEVGPRAEDARRYLQGPARVAEEDDGVPGGA